MGAEGICLERVCGNYGRLACRPDFENERGAPAQTFPLHTICNLTSISCVARNNPAVNNQFVFCFVLFCNGISARHVAAIGAHSKPLIALIRL